MSVLCPIFVLMLLLGAESCGAPNFITSHFVGKQSKSRIECRRFRITKQCFLKITFIFIIFIKLPPCSDNQLKTTNSKNIVLSEQNSENFFWPAYITEG